MLLLFFKKAKPIKYLIVLASVFIIDYVIVTLLWKYGYMDWLWTCIVELCAGTSFIVDSHTLDQQAFLTAVLKAFAGLISGTCILVFLWECVPNMVLTVFGEDKIREEERQE